ncbi:MAG: hypothetical protein ACRC62_03545 [Microcoleus sp.]
MAIPVLSTQQFALGARILGLQSAIASDEPVTLSQLTNFVNNLNWKDNVRAASTGDVNLASPGAALDAVTLANGDRVLLKNQTTATQNGIYTWTGAAIALTRTPDTDSFDKLESAVVTVDEGTTNGGTKWRQTQVNGVIGTNNIAFVPDGTAAAAASETVAGVAEIATQAETDAGTDDLRIVTPAKLRNSSYALRAVSSTIGDGTASTFSVTHSFNTFDVDVVVREATGARRQVIVETDTPDVNTARILFAGAPAASSYRVTVRKSS